MQEIQIAAIAAALIFACGTARCQFINGIEDFNGTSFDNNTWARYSFGLGTASVSNGYLDITGQNYLGTKSLTVGVGETIGARVTLTAATSNGTVLDMGLTSTPLAPPNGQQAYLCLEHSIQGESDLVFFSGNGGASGARHLMDDNIGLWYRMQLSRTSLSDYTCELFADDGSTIFSFSASYVGLPDRASIFVGLGPTARFDWIAVPEPGALMCLVLGCVLPLRRRAPNRWPY